jgi:Sugar-transfer associated ATP-grasp
MKSNNPPGGQSAVSNGTSHPLAQLGSVLQTADQKLYQTVRTTHGWMKKEWQAPPTGLPLTRKLDMWRRGFFAESDTIYDLARNDPGEYLSDFQHYVRCSRINAWNGFYGHKMVLRSFLLAIGLRQANTVALVLDGRILLHPYDGKARYVEPAEMVQLLSTWQGERKFIVKPEDGWCGEDIFLLTHQDGQFFKQRGRSIETIDLEAFLRTIKPPRRKGRPASATLIEERIQQGPFWASLFPDSANTIRLFTMWHPQEPAPFVARAVQRIGTADTVPTDNWSGGGISVPVDPETGRLGLGRMHPLKGKRPEQRFERHPDSGAQLTGAVVPYWDQITGAVLQAAGSLPFNRMGGWDVLVDSTGTPIILEANGNSDVNLLQVHGGLLADPRIRRFYQAFGVVS